MLKGNAEGIFEVSRDRTYLERKITEIEAVLKQTGNPKNKDTTWACYLLRYCLERNRKQLVALDKAREA